jgi:hypothetical protein
MFLSCWYSLKNFQSLPVPCFTFRLEVTLAQNSSVSDHPAAKATNYNRASNIQVTKTDIPAFPNLLLNPPASPVFAYIPNEACPQNDLQAADHCHKCSRKLHRYHTLGAFDQQYEHLAQATWLDRSVLLVWLPAAREVANLGESNTRSPLHYTRISNFKEQIQS